MLKRADKEKIIGEVKADIEKAQAVFLTNLIGIPANDAVEVRKAIRESDGKVVVTKNTLFQKAAEGTAAEELFKSIKGPHSVAFAFSDAASVAKCLKKASDKFEGVVELKSGLLQGEPLNAAQLKELANLPGRDEMLATLLATFNAPVSAFVRAINAIKEQKESGGEIAAEVATAETTGPEETDSEGGESAE